ncbi:MAG: winged helix-turn-helix domain-containing protein [Candidatus Thermoplasmatota archaeon]|nr:winged helix-turn-helix domain-containing protein [Candidatus Thermoplasmatota archaeon]
MKPAKKLLWWLLAGTSGGLSRGRIIEKIMEKPTNANELADVLHLDYKTVRHHLNVLQKNRLVTTMGSGYGTMYFPSEILEENMEYFNEIWDEIGKNKKKDERNGVKK